MKKKRSWFVTKKHSQRKPEKQSGETRSAEKKPSCERWREGALPHEESTDGTGREGGGVRARLHRSLLQSPPSVMWALHPSGNPSSRPSDNVSSGLSRNCCPLPSGHTSAHPLLPHLPSPSPATPVVAPSGNTCDLPRVMPVLSPPAIPALALFRDSCALPSSHHRCKESC